MFQTYKSRVILCTVIIHILNANLLGALAQKSNAEASSISLPALPSFSLRNHDYCRNLAEFHQCECNETYTQINCKSFNIDITNKKAIVSCKEVYIDGFIEEPPLLKVTIDPFLTVQITNCSLSHNNKTLKEFLSYLGIYRLRKLIFVSNETSVGSQQLSGLQDLRFLSYDIISSQALPSNLFEGVPNIKTLQLITNQTQLPRGIFDHLTNLRKLLINGKNHETRFPIGIFQNLKHLEHLTISNCKRLIFSKDLFENTSNIETLNLINDVITSLPSGFFDNLTNLTYLNLNGNSIDYLPPELLRKTTKLKSFKLNSNNGNLRTLPAGLLGNLSSLIHIELSAGLEELPEDLFKGSRKVEVIKLNNNKLSNLPSKLFSDHEKLKNLDLSRNLLTVLPDDIFGNLSFLQELNLSHNQLTVITSLSFSGLSYLQNLSLDYNELRSIDQGAFVSTADLMYLNLKQNHLQNILCNLRFSFRKLRELDLSYNNITFITSEDLIFISHYGSLHINLSENLIESVDFLHSDLKVFSGTSVDLSGNPIKCDCRIGNFVVFLRKQASLEAKGNGLEPSTFIYDRNRITIEARDLRCMKPTHLYGITLREIDLCDLTCTRTEPESCPELCQCKLRFCDNAFIIDCSNSNLFHLPTLPSFDFLSTRKILLDMQHNNLTDLPQNRSESFDEVRSLNRTGNNLQNIAGSQLPANLEILDLRRNNLNTVLFDLWNENFTKLNEIYLSNNPWPCSCDSKGLLRFVQGNYKKVVDRNILRCLDSSNQRKDLMSFTSSQLCPDKKHVVIAIASTITICALMIAILVSVYYRYKNEIKVWLYSHNMCLWFVSIEDLEKDKEYDGFVSYSHKDKDFVQKELLPFLEHGPHPFKICDHERDWLVGDTIPEQIIKSVENSRRTLIVLSDNYLESVWGRMEFQAAHQCAMKERQAKVIIILYGKIKNTEKIDAELKAYLSMNTYLEWGNPWFWRKLLYAMPHSKYSKTIREFEGDSYEMN